MPKCDKMHSTSEFICFWEKIRHFTSPPSATYATNEKKKSSLSALKLGFNDDIPIMALILGPALLKKGRKIFFLA